MEHDELCPIPVDQRMPGAVSCLWCEVLMKARIDSRLRERERLRRLVETLGGYVRKQEDGDYVPLPVVLLLFEGER